MLYSRIDHTGWEISRISLGTAGLGMEYGFPYEGEAPVPDRAEAKRLVLEALDRGITLIDTSPTYRGAEEIIGEALRDWRGRDIFIASKLLSWVKRPEAHVDGSLQRLRRDTIDLLQIYSRSDDEGEFLRGLEIGLRCQSSGKARALGITLYDESIGARAVACPELASIQVPYSLLDRRFARSVIPEASRKGQAVLSRSAFLKGMLTERRRRVSPDLATLARNADKLAERFAEAGRDLAEGALEFCLTQPQITSVLVGVKNRTELAAALKVAETHRDSDWIRNLPIEDVGESVDPRRWKPDPLSPAPATET